MDPSHLLSLMDHAEARDRRKGKGRTTGPPMEVEPLKPGDRHYRPPKTRSAAAEKAYEESTRPTEADLDAVRAGVPIRTRSIRHMVRIMRAREIVKAEREGRDDGD